MNHKLRQGVLATVLGCFALATPAAAEPVTLQVVHAWGGHKRFHEPIAQEFMAQHPDIKIEFRAPMKSYIDGHQAILREALTNDLPDIWYSGYSNLPELVRTLSARGQIEEITPLLEGEGKAWVDANYAPNVLALAQVDGKQWGMPFNASTPITYYNLDLVAKAGGNPANLPTDWDGVIDLAKKITTLGDDVDGLSYWYQDGDGDWLWQALVFNFGGDMMDKAATKVTFGGDAGMKAVTLARQLVTDTQMPFLNEDQSIQQFAAGKLGILFGSTAEVRVMGELVGDKFAWKTNGYPVADKAKGGLPVGGNAAVILADDPVKQKAAWEFIKFVTGPEGQKIAVLGSGYMPTNLRATEAAYLGDFYQKNPDWTTSLKQWPVAKSWFGYPGNQGIKIWRAQATILNAIARGETAPEPGLQDMVKVTEELLAH
jgi:multiple sugar transport system substrate-binding protein